MTNTPSDRAAPFEVLLREVVAQAPVALLQIDLAGVVRFAAGPALLVPPVQLVGRAVADLVGSEEQAAWVGRALLGEHGSEGLELVGRHWQLQYAPLRHRGVVTDAVAVLTDVTQLLAERDRAADQAHLNAVFQAVAEALIVIDPHGTVSLANGQCARLFGAPVRPGTNLRDLLDNKTVALVERQLARRAAGDSDHYELALRDADGAPIWLLVSASPVVAADGQFLGSVAVLTDIAARKAAEERLESAARTDPLTGVANRTTLTDRLAHGLARRGTGIIAVMFCDVDELKTTNDRFGHAAGDELLRQVAHRITATLRPADTVARYGGDEFRCGLRGAPLRRRGAAPGRARPFSGRRPPAGRQRSAPPHRQHWRGHRPTPSFRRRADGRRRLSRLPGEERRTQPRAPLTR